MGHEGRGKSKADGLKAMESEATLHFGLFFSEADLGVIHIYVHTYACMHMHSHTYIHTHTVYTPAANQDTGHLGLPGSFLGPLQ